MEFKFAEYFLLEINAKLMNVFAQIISKIQQGEINLSKKSFFVHAKGILDRLNPKEQSNVISMINLIFKEEASEKNLPSLCVKELNLKIKEYEILRTKRQVKVI